MRRAIWHETRYATGPSEVWLGMYDDDGDEWWFNIATRDRITSSGAYIFYTSTFGTKVGAP